MNKREKEILFYLYRFRFLTREQVQGILDQKHSSRTAVWLDNLLNKGFIKRFYNPRIVNKAAVYTLDNGGRKYLIENSKDLKLNKTTLDKVWRSNKLTNQFRDHCMTLANCYIALKETVSKTGANLKFYSKNDLIGIKYLVTPHPDAYFYIQETNGLKKYYFLEIFDFYTNSLKLIKRVQKYLDYYDDNYWQEETGCIFPEVIMVTSDQRSYSYLNWHIPKVLEYRDEVNFYLISKVRMKTEGINKGTLKKMVVED